MRRHERPRVLLLLMHVRDWERHGPSEGRVV